MKGYLFDLDGTLLDSNKMWRSLTTNFLNRHKITFTEEIAQELTTMSIYKSAAYLRHTLKVNLTEEEIIRELEQEIIEGYTKDVELKDGALEYLSYLKEKDIPMGLATATNDKFVDLIMERFGIGKYFDFVATVDNIGILKNDPKFYIEAAKKFPLPPSETTIFDDAPYAIEAAVEAGLRVYAVYDQVNGSFYEGNKKIAYKGIESFREMII